MNFSEDDSGKDRGQARAGAKPVDPRVVKAKPIVFKPIAVKPLDGKRDRRMGGRGLIAGVDEVGRGPLAGPVAAAAVILDPKRIPVGLRDSKELSELERERLFAEIMASAHVGIAFSGPAEIDRVNIRQATLCAMRRAVNALPVPPDHVLIDGRDVPPGIACAAQAIVKGDSLLASIAAASIVAKVIRDRTMRNIGIRYPAFGFASNVGYPTPQHLDALAILGPSPFHRLSFAPVRRFLDEALIPNAG
jgi:ribonuclease HII